jgi:hypothetical protein
MPDEPSPDAVPNAADAGASAAQGTTEGVNQGATGNRPLGETPLSEQTDKDAFDERPEAFVGAAFAGGLALALVLRRLAR